MKIKRCHKCGKEKSLKDFAKNKDKKDGRATTCLECNREYTKKHYKANKQYYLRKNNIRETIAKKFIDGARETGFCKDCGNNDPEVLDFDHVKGKKEFSLSYARKGTISLNRIQKELEKCELVCANCHRKRTRKRERDLVKI